MYSEYEWQPHKFKTSRGYWKDKNNHKQFFDQLAKDWNFQSMDDWYKVTVHDVYDHGGSTLLNKYYNGSLVKALTSVSYSDIVDIFVFLMLAASAANIRNTKMSTISLSLPQRSCSHHFLLRSQYRYTPRTSGKCGNFIKFLVIIGIPTPIFALFSLLSVLDSISLL